MKEFLKKYLSEEQLKAIEDAYIADHEGAKGLPVYISKARLDEVLGKQHTAESERDNFKTEIETLKANKQKEIDDAVAKAIEEQKKAGETQIEELKKANEAALAEQKKGFEITEEIYKAKGKNVVAIKALIDPTKDYKAEIARLQKDESYLFEQGSDDVPGGTGKQGADKSKETLDAMRKAVGLTR